MTDDYRARMRERYAVERRKRITMTPELQAEFDERVAICMIDGGLTESETTEIAWKQIEEK